jgi:hypothetical protein
MFQARDSGCGGIGSMGPGDQNVTIAVASHFSQEGAIN